MSPEFTLSLDTSEASSDQISSDKMCTVEVLHALSLTSLLFGVGLACSRLPVRDEVQGHVDRQTQGGPQGEQASTSRVF
eukprot:631570-Pyramimonas_sp.AAC.2